MKHLQEFNVGYFSHLYRALSFFVKCIFWSAEVFIHAFVPELFTNTAEKMKREIQRLEAR